jgi:predicted nuclease of predicted toxin-antitoxin system
MKFIVDAQLPPALAAWLRAKGHEASALRDIGLRDASDEEIWRHVGDDGVVIVTKDEDFAKIAASDMAGPRILWVRTGNLVNRLLLVSFERTWPEIQAHLAAGARIVELR